TVLVGRRKDFQIARTIECQPSPSGAKAVGRFVGEFLLETLKAAESRFDRGSQTPDRFSSLARTHDLPEEAVVGVATTIVPHRGAAGFGNDCAVVCQQLLQTLTLELRMRFDSSVELADIGGMVFPMVNLHRSSIYVRFESVRRIR